MDDKRVDNGLVFHKVIIFSHMGDKVFSGVAKCTNFVVDSNGVETAKAHFEQGITIKVLRVDGIWMGWV